MGLAATKAIDPKWAWHYRALVGLRERLLKERADHRQAAAEVLEPHSMDIADTATDELDHDLVLSQLSAEQDALYEIDEALKRILSGTYGTCEETGKPIPAERLRAIPWTRFSKDVEARLEKEGMVGHAHLGQVASVRKSAAKSLEESETQEGEKSEPAADDEALSQVYSSRGKNLRGRKDTAKK